MLTELRPLNEDEAFVFMVLDKMNDKDVDILFEQIIDENGWVLKAIEKRFTAFYVEAERRTMIAILTMADGAVGKAAQIIDDIVEWAKAKHFKIISLKCLCLQIYPNGVPAL